MIKILTQSAALMPLVLTSSLSIADNDTRQLVHLPEMMQQHMMSNMRDHLVAINEILVNLGNGEMDKAAEIAEQRLGMSSLESHGASHMAKFMPEGMRHAGTSMHRAASRFALKAQEGELLPVRNEEVTLKRIEQKRGEVVLHPANAGMEAMAYLPDEVQVQGVLKGLLRSYR